MSKVVDKRRFRRKNDDEYETPKDVWESIRDYIPKGKVIWEAFFCSGKSGTFLKELGFDVIHKDIDFFKHDEGDIIVSNPPYSIKKEVLTRLKNLNKPFILIMPSETINTKYVRELFKNEIQIIIPRGRINFLKNGEQTGRCSFSCFFYCWKIGLEKDIIFL